MTTPDVPTIVRDRRAVMSAACYAVLALEVERQREGGDTLRNLARVLIQHLRSHGVELRVRHGVRP